jgi:hypothetical protein
MAPMSPPPIGASSFGSSATVVVLDIEIIAKVRYCANTGLALGTEFFLEQVNKLRN